VNPAGDSTRLSAAAMSGRTTDNFVDGELIPGDVEDCGEVFRLMDLKGLEAALSGEVQGLLSRPA